MARRKKDPIVKAAEEPGLGKKVRFKANAEEARKRTTHVKETYASMGKLWWQLGAEVKACIDDYVPEALGKKATEWMKECFGDAWLKVYRAHRAIAALPGIPESKLEKISEGNAYHLARLPVNIRKKPEAIEKAIKMPNDQFKEYVEKQREKKGVKRDPMVKWSEIFKIGSVPKTLAKLMGHALEIAGKAENVDLDTKEGRIHAIELIFSEFVTSQAQPSEIVVDRESFEQGEAVVETEQEVSGEDIAAESGQEAPEAHEAEQPEESHQKRRRKASAA